MVSLVDVSNPQNSYTGRVFWEMVRPGARLAVLGPRGCMTSTIAKVVVTARDQYVIQTRNSRYLLTAHRTARPEEIRRAAVA